MSTFELDENPAIYQIRSYQPGRITVNDTLYTKSILITPKTLAEWCVSSIARLSPESFAPIIALKPDILLIGTGDQLTFPDITLYGHLLNHGIGVEIMTTHAACRTFSVLSSEDRNVAAALII